MSNRRNGWPGLLWGIAGLVLIALGYPPPARPGAVWAQTIPPVTCREGLANGGFETDAAWTLPVTAYRARYSSEQVHSGARSLRAGILDPAANVFSYSSAYQPLQLPTGTPTLTLSLWWYPVSTESELAQLAAVDEATLQAVAEGRTPATPLSGDQQYLLLTDPQNRILARLLWTRSDARRWQLATFDLTSYAGRSVRLHAGVYNDGAGGVTALYLDDVSLSACTPSAGGGYLPLIYTAPLTPTATPTATATVTPTATLTATPTATPTSTVVWSDPATAIELLSPVAGGRYHSPIQVHGFSQTFEGNVNLRLTGPTGELLAERNAIGGSVDGFAFFESYLRFTVSSPVSATLTALETDAGDGSVHTQVQVPLVLLPGQRVVDLTTPAVGMAVCSPLLVAGYSNTFEATVVVTLHARDGGEVARTSTQGGNLGVYADFATTLTRTVTAPQPLLVGAFEESAAGFGPIDQTRVPVALYPPGAGPCP